MLMEVSKFIVTGDLHWTGKNPRARLDDYKSALVNKLEEIKRLAMVNQVDGVIIPGDITDTPGIALSVLAELMTILQDFPCPIFTIGGNHDWYGGNPKTENRTPYGILTRAGAIIDINNIYNMYRVPFHVWLMGRSWDSEVTDRDIEYYTFKNKCPNSVTNKRVRVLVTHGMLLDKSPGYEVRHTLMSEVASHPDAPDILINGHIHDCQGIQKINNTLFINPGSIGRKSATEENLERIPQVVLLAIPEKEHGEPFAELIPLKSASPGHLVLSREHIEEEQKRQEITKEFLELLAEEGDSRYQDLEEIVKGIGERKNIPPNIVQEALKRLEDAREEGHHEKRTEIY